MSAAAMAVEKAVSEKVSKPVDPKQGKGGKTVTKAVTTAKAVLKPVPTNGHKQVHIKQDVEKNGVLKALRYALNDSGAVFTEDERAGAQRVLDRLIARA